MTHESCPMCGHVWGRIPLCGICRWAFQFVDLNQIECVLRAAGVNRTESGEGLRCADFLMVNTPIPYPSNTDPAAEPKTVKNSN
jgi:hypothetical protein